MAFRGFCYQNVPKTQLSSRYYSFQKHSSFLIVEINCQTLMRIFKLHRNLIKKTNVNHSNNYDSFFIIVQSGGTLWDPQKFLQYNKYVMLS
jgi:hypothetical protein